LNPILSLRLVQELGGCQLGEMPESYATADYPNIHFHEDNILISYDHNPWHPPAGIWTLRILPVAELYE